MHRLSVAFVSCLLAKYLPTQISVSRIKERRARTTDPGGKRYVCRWWRSLSV